MPYENHNACYRSAMMFAAAWALRLRAFAVFLAFVIMINPSWMASPARAQNTPGSQSTSLASRSAPSKTADMASDEASVVTTDPNLLLLSAIRQSVWGPPLSCKVYQWSNAYGQQTVVSGDFKRAGSGTGQFRYAVRISSGETTQDMIQVSDGRLMYTQIGVTEPPRRVFLDQIQQSLSYSINHANERPEVNIYLAIGGQAELLRGLYHRYNWYKARKGTIAGNEVWQMVGRLRTETPQLVGHTKLDDQNGLLGQPPENLPTEARLTLGRSTALAYFPHKIEYMRRSKPTAGRPSEFELVSVIEFNEPNTAMTVDSRDFQFRVPDNTDKIEDETSLYLPTQPIEGLPMFPR